jgi:hypothetical protein
MAAMDNNQLPMSEAEMLEITARVMKDQEPIQFIIHMMDAWVLVSQLQLVTRHPDISDAMRKFAEHTGHEIQKSIVAKYPEAEAVINLGWNTRFDVDRAGDFVNPHEEKVVHNIFTLYSDDEAALLAFGKRPQDWGEPNWKYKKVETRVSIQGQAYKQVAHFWFTENYSDAEFLQQDWVKQMIGSIYQPGASEELCGRDFLDEDDFWQEDWGKMPPHYEQDNEDYWGDE